MLGAGIEALKDKFQNTQEIKRTRFNGSKQDKSANFQGSPLFQATYNIKTINSTYLVSVGCGRLVEGKGQETGV